MSTSAENDLGIAIDNITTGTIIVLYDGEWRSVCDNAWSQEDAKVACRQLGLSTRGKSKFSFLNHVIEQYTVPGGQINTQKFWMDKVNCKGDEESLFECKHSGLDRARPITCDNGERAKIMC